ncbi:MAG: glycosyltransferase family 39 protein, partial [Oscillospiraceae bacterium]|nr:glycosyltransferase family 39 protein [Oscillospiraceae bacterium]
MAFFESLLVRVFGAHFTAAKILNICLMNLINWQIYRLACRKMDAAAARFTYVLAAFFLAWFLSAPQLSNQHMATVLLLAAFALHETKKWYFAALAGVIVALLNVLRPMGIICVLAILVSLLLEALHDKSWKHWRICLLRGGAFLL